MTGTQWPVAEVTKLPDDFTIHAAQGFINVKGPEFYAARLVDQAVTKIMAGHDQPTVPTTTPTSPAKKANLMNASTLYPAGRPVRLPAKLDVAACMAILKRIDPEVNVDSIAAARDTLTVERLDQALAYTDLSISDRMHYKAALVEHGILARGVRTSIRHL
jgi:hypothetical protein